MTGTGAASPRAARMSEVAARLVGGLGDRDLELVAVRRGDPSWTTWSYLPGDRPGLPLESAPDALLEQVAQLVGLAHSEAGAALVSGAVEVERERRRSVTGVTPAGDRYWLRILGDPATGSWAWRLNGHHVGVHVAVDGEELTFTPHFIGSEPALLTTGDLAGRRILGPEEDLARELVQALRPGQRERALSDVAPADILTGNDPVADASVLPDGIRRGDLDAGQRRVLDALVRRYLDRVPQSYADACWEETMDLAADEVEFAWAGSTVVGGPHYYCVRTPVFLIEYDNTQDDANHAHSVWRHLRDDFGGDALRQHHRSAHQPLRDHPVT